MLFFVFFARFLLKSHSPCRKKNIFEKQKKNREKLDQVLTQKKAFFGPSFDSTADIYVYTHTDRFFVFLIFFKELWGVSFWVLFSNGRVISGPGGFGALSLLPESQP